MHHFFVINPVAGFNNSVLALSEQIKTIFQDSTDTFEIYVTNKPREATDIVRLKSKAYHLPITFYACGGEGTSFEVLNGMASFPHARLSIVPIGSCNDFLKQFPADFSNIADLVQGTERSIDCLKVNDCYALNAVDIGFDACVNDDCLKFKSTSKSIKAAYNKAILKNLFKNFKHQIGIQSSDFSYQGPVLQMVVSNGQYYGGGYHVTPKASVTDHQLDILIVKKLSHLRFLRMIRYYKRGEHVDNPQLSDIVVYHQTEEVVLKCPKPAIVCVDGETFIWQDIKVTVLPDQIRMVFPKESHNG